MTNVMYNPQDFGLEYVCEVYLEEPNWDFYILRVLKNEQGYWMGTDSGCSCPSPFENYNGMEDLTGPLTAEQVREEAKSLWNGYDEPDFSSEMSKVV
jgi:hypothetical protein